VAATAQGRVQCFNLCS